MAKKSRFNFIYKRSENEYAIYNTYSKALILLNENEMNQYKKDEFKNCELVEELLENGVLVEDLFDEIGFMTYCHNQTKYAQDALHLVIATTMDCNFGCPYCYENRRKGHMSDDIQNAIFNFIVEHVSRGIKHLDVTWYGGEPLLYPEIIEKLGNRIKSFCKEKNVELMTYIVTNGYLLTERTVELLDELEVAKAQITLDGLREHHDSRRFLRDGSGTFDKIYDNLKLFDDYSIRVDIRMNVDNENYCDYVELKDLIEKLENPNIKVYPSPVEDINKDTINNVSDFMSFDEFENFAKDLCESGDSGTAETKVLDDRYCYCQAETENSYVIDELGNFYKCWDQCGRVETSCFNIMNIENKNYTNITKFLSWDPFRDEKCKDCVFLPVCFGGCKFHRMNTGRYDCGFTEESMKSYLEGAFFNN